MAAPVMRNDAIALLHEVEHLGVPVVGAERPAMTEDDGLRVLGTPGLVVDLRAIFGCDRRHGPLQRPRLRVARDRRSRARWAVSPPSRPMRRTSSRRLR